MRQIVMNNKLEIPQIGVGTWTLRGETARQNVRLARKRDSGISTRPRAMRTRPRWGRASAAAGVGAEIHEDGLADCAAVDCAARPDYHTAGQAQSFCREPGNHGLRAL